MMDFNILTNPVFLSSLIVFLIIALRTEIIPVFIFRRRLFSALLAFLVLNLVLITYGPRLFPSFSLDGEQIAIVLFTAFISAVIREGMDTWFRIR